MVGCLGSHGIPGVARSISRASAIGSIPAEGVKVVLVISQEDLDNWFTYHSPTPAQTTQYVELRAAGKAFAEALEQHAGVRAAEARLDRRIGAAGGVGVRPAAHVILQSDTSGTCDVCWGTGRTDRIGIDLRERLKRVRED